eukprot:1321945-Pleurochrysis_carterae.AAC.1
MRHYGYLPAHPVNGLVGQKAFGCAAATLICLKAGRAEARGDDGVKNIAGYFAGALNLLGSRSAQTIRTLKDIIKGLKGRLHGRSGSWDAPLAKRQRVEPPRAQRSANGGLRREGRSYTASALHALRFTAKCRESDDDSSPLAGDKKVPVGSGFRKSSRWLTRHVR